MVFNLRTNVPSTHWLCMEQPLPRYVIANWLGMEQLLAMYRIAVGYVNNSHWLCTQQLLAKCKIVVGYVWNSGWLCKEQSLAIYRIAISQIVHTCCLGTNVGRPWQPMFGHQVIISIQYIGCPWQPMPSTTLCYNCRHKCRVPTVTYVWPSGCLCKFFCILAAHGNLCLAQLSAHLMA